MIGVFDSGLGGLTVIHELERVLPDETFLYLGDTARTPYGTKSNETIEHYAAEDTAFLLGHGVEAVVVACNTVSAVALATVERAATVPVFDVVRPAVAAALASGAVRIGVIGTRATVETGIYKRLIRKGEGDHVVFSAACPLLVPLVEEGKLDHPATTMILREYLAPLLAEHIDALILGCTHYPLLEPAIRSVTGPDVHIINPARALAHKVVAGRGNAQRKPAESSRYYLTDITPASHEIAARALGHDVRFERAVVG